jgi:hypothetical protein
MCKHMTSIAVRPVAMIVALAAPAVIDAQDRVADEIATRETIWADLGNVRGLNYIASYAPPDVAMWRFYDHDQIEAAQREDDIEARNKTLSKLAKLAAELLVDHGFVEEDGAPVSRPVGPEGDANR